MQNPEGSVAGSLGTWRNCRAIFRKHCLSSPVPGTHSPGGAQIGPGCPMVPPDAQKSLGGKRFATVPSLVLSVDSDFWGDLGASMGPMGGFSLVG